MSNLMPGQGTTYVKNEEIKKDWILVDAKDQVLGRLAGRIAHRLRGKHKPDYTPYQDNGDFVVVINARHIVTTGSKMDQKVYYKHSHYPGGLKETLLKDAMIKDPTFAIKKAVQRMLPSGPMGRKLLGNLRVYADADHGHNSQKPELWNIQYK
ncbi:MAG: 50S ribosomal protein L13 [Spirochaetia bacterium]|nr:50S ribosomal protein L13 [Spirochaetia bacterium]